MVSSKFKDSKVYMKNYLPNGMKIDRLDLIDSQTLKKIFMDRLNNNSSDTNNWEYATIQYALRVSDIGLISFSDAKTDS